MLIPRFWTKVGDEGELPDGRRIPLSVWGWGDDEASAQRTAIERLARLMARLKRGEPMPGSYPYGGSRPLREEILHVYQGQGRDTPDAVVTRNGYGCMVLNTARLLFLDVDFESPGLLAGLLRLFGIGPSAEERSLTRLRDGLRAGSTATFRIYRTAAGLRVMAVDRDFDPAGREALELMQATGTDRRFARLCKVQQSFRARLGPKPWRCRLAKPPRSYPRSEPEQREFAAWLEDYEKGSADYATCRYLETLGEGRPAPDVARLIDLHDRLTRCHDPLPLA
ncbi:MAG: hypothetical protein H6807_07235 [Planctomycetes bacterium]|nr:hypothetical protein [Planctomycetota bacterium]